MISIGSIKLKDIYAGSDKIKEIYVGNKHLWSSFQMYFTQTTFEQDDLNDRIILKIIQTDPISESILDKFNYNIEGKDVELGQIVEEVCISDPIVDSSVNQISFKITSTYKDIYNYKKLTIKHSNGPEASIQVRHFTNYITTLSLPESVAYYKRSIDSDEFFIRESPWITFEPRDESKPVDIDLVVDSATNCTANIDSYYHLNIYPLDSLGPGLGYVKIKDNVTGKVAEISLLRDYNMISYIELPSDPVIIEAGDSVEIPATITYEPLDYYNGDDNLHIESATNELDLTANITENSTIIITAPISVNKSALSDLHTVSLVTEKFHSEMIPKSFNLDFKIQQVLYLDVQIANDLYDYDLSIEDSSYIKIYYDNGTHIEYNLPSNYTLTRGEYYNSISFGKVLTAEQTDLIGDLNNTECTISVYLNLKYTNDADIRSYTSTSSPSIISNAIANDGVIHIYAKQFDHADI